MGSVASPALLGHLIDALLDEATRSEAEQLELSEGDIVYVRPDASAPELTPA